ncbi:MAG TPA: amidohydrolase family protein [Chryseosolibacter sp.]
MIIDSHQHFWKYAPATHSWISDDMNVLKRDFLPGDFETIARSKGIAGTVAVQADQSEDETDFLLSLAKKSEFIKGVVGWVDLRAANLDTSLKKYSAEKLLKGFRHVVQAEPPGFLLDPRFIEGVNKLSEYGFTYDLLIYHHQLEEALKFAAKTSGVRIVVDHIAKPSIRTGEKTHWELNLAALATFKNVHCKLSGMVTEARWNDWTYADIEPFIDEVFESFGPQRIMYGSDWPVCLVAGSYDDQFSVVENYISRLSESEKRNVLSENAKRFYNL